MLLVLGILFFQILVSNRNMKWPIVAEYLFDAKILAGLGMTLLLTVLSMIIGLAIGIVLAIMRLSTGKVFRAVSWAWIWFFRGVPPLVQMIFWYNLALLLPEISIGIPFGPKLVSWNTNDLLTPFSAAIMGLAFTESAYAAEMIRAGIQAVSHGQTCLLYTSPSPRD